MAEEHINVSADHNEPGFFSDSLTISHGPSKFIFDFTQTTPRFDIVHGERQQSLAIKHKTIIVDPVLAKIMMKILNENVETFEKQFGTIKLPKEEKKPKKIAPVASESASYIG